MINTDAVLNLPVEHPHTNERLTVAEYVARTVGLYLVGGPIEPISEIWVTALEAAVNEAKARGVKLSTDPTDAATTLLMASLTALAGCENRTTVWEVEAGLEETFYQRLYTTDRAALRHGLAGGVQAIAEEISVDLEPEEIPDMAWKADDSVTVDGYYRWVDTVTGGWVTATKVFLFDGSEPQDAVVAPAAA